jgi:flagellar protein FliO/FliZ
MRNFPVLLLTALLSGFARAESAPAPDVGGSLLQLLLGLAIVLALMWGSMILLKRIAAPRGAASGMLKVITAAAVGPRERVVIVEVGDKWLVLGVAPGRVTPLHELPKGETPPTAALAAPDFAARLKGMLERRGHAS